MLFRSYHLVALTNGNADIHKTGLTRVFDQQISAADVQAAKPDPAMFNKAMDDYSVTHNETLHIGDHDIHDIWGAQQLGITSVWVNRQNQPWNTADFQADYEISDLTGLLNILL